MPKLKWTEKQNALHESYWIAEANCYVLVASVLGWCVKLQPITDHYLKTQYLTGKVDIVVFMEEAERWLAQHLAETAGLLSPVKAT